MKTKMKTITLICSLTTLTVLGSACGPSRHTSGVVVVGSGGYSSGGIVTSSGGYSSGGYSSGGIVTSSGGVSSSGGTTNGSSNGTSSSGNSSSNGSNGYSVSTGAGPMVAGDCASVDGCVAAAGSIQVPTALLSANAAASTDPFSAAQSGIANSVDTDTKDVDLQRADLQGAALDTQAQSIAGQFGMSFDSAKQLAQLVDKMSTLNASGSVSEEDRETITHAALGIAGLSTDDVNAAIASTLKGDKTAIDGLMSKAAANLGMQSSAGLRDQLLPTLGINF